MKAKNNDRQTNGEKVAERYPEIKPVETAEIFYKLRIPVIASGDINADQRATVGVILRFIEKLLGVPLPPAAWKINSFHSEITDKNVDCLALPGRHLWALRYNHKGYYLWNFATIERCGKLEFGIEAARNTGQDIGVQEILKSLAGVMNLKSEIPLGGEFWHVSDEEQCNSLWRYLNMPERRFPVIIVSEMNLSSLNSPYEPHFLVKPSQLAAKFYGCAGIVTMDYQGTRIWRELFGREWAAFDGAVRTVQPLKSKECESLIIFKDAIRQFDAGEKRGYASFIEFLERGVSNCMARQYVNWDGMFFYDSALVLLEESIKLSGRKRGRPPKQKSDETLLEQRFQASQKELSKLRHRLHIDSPPLESVMESRKSRNLPPKVNTNQEKNPYEELFNWATTELAGKIYLHPRAQRGLLKAKYRSPELIRQALSLLANEYRDCRLKKMEDKVLKRRYQELGLAYRRSIALVRATAENDSYFIDYPPENPKRRFLKYKLGKGTSHQPRYCLRIYFFWDSEKQVVVIGSLPHHLSNRAT